ncbi:hypothetical protein FMM08_22470 [Quadrisphaera setariae]|uniref:Uncharacterized protein n=1 Tax=Quadrisphaera setariae TaxID=2593304 RepID=A0A5C8Z253_9ACTN|nr:hypothetical protein FMM08_22470 [Quadrisphaera setariae]
MRRYTPPVTSSMATSKVPEVRGRAAARAAGAVATWAACIASAEVAVMARTPARTVRREGAAEIEVGLVGASGELSWVVIDRLLVVVVRCRSSQGREPTW